MTWKLERATRCTQKRLKLGMVSSLNPHNMCQKLRGVRQKLDALRVQTGPSLSKYEFQRNFIFLNLFQLKTFFTSNMQHSKPHTETSTLSDYICYFHAFNDLF